MVAAVAFGLTSLHVARSSDGGLSCRPRHGAAAGHRRCDDAVSRTGRSGVVAVRICAAKRAAAVCGAAVGWFLGQSAWPLALGVATMGCATLGLWLATRGLRAPARNVKHQRRPKRLLSSQPSRPPVPVVAARCWRRPVARAAVRAASAVAEESREETAAAGRAGQACDRHALVGAAHEPAPDLDRQAAPSHVLGRRAIVIAEPDAGHEMRGVADEPGIAEILRRAGFPGRGPAGNAALCAVPMVSVSAIIWFIIAT